MQTLAKRVEQIAPFQVMAVMGRAKDLQAQGKDVIHLEVGEPDFGTGQAIATAGQEAVAQGNTGYTAATGLPELRQAISDFYRTRYQVSVAPERIIVTPGASGALILLSSLMVDAGSEVLMPDPCYPCNRNFLAQVGAHAKMLDCTDNPDFAIDLTTLEQQWQPHTSGLWLASPANPTGSVLSKDYVSQAWQIVQRQGGHLLVDEIYQGLVFDGEDFTALSVSDDIFVVNSFSKYFAMTGWRLGWIVVPEWAVEGATKLAQNLFICAPSISQYAALKAFENDALDECEARRQRLAERRSTLIEGLARLGLPIASAPQGAFYVYVDVSSLTDDAMRWSLALLEQEYVALTPGADFGLRNAHRYVRFAYTCDSERINEALQRIERFIKSAY